MKPAFSVCVYCGSRPGTDAAFADVARQTGQWIGAHGGQLVYGGGNNGLMGMVADATLAAGGRVVGVIPKALVVVFVQPGRHRRVGPGPVAVAGGGEG